VKNDRSEYYDCKLKTQLEETDIFHKIDNWKGRKQKQPITQKLKKIFHKPEKISAKERIFKANYLIDSNAKKLRSLSERLKKRDNLFFTKCIKAQLAHNRLKAILYANECAELRKIAKIVISSELALEQAALRLQTISQLGDVFSTMTPIIEIVNETKGQLTGIIPSIAGKLKEINYMLQSVSESSTHDRSAKMPDISPNSSEATTILEAAYLTAEEKLKEQFPKLPSEEEIPLEPINSRILVTS
jgi:division protein CdvB (Snf7/Vps24/ESCRT-III family)